MCGIAGFIGKSLNPELSFKIMTETLASLESRGKDSTGFYGTECGDNGKVYFYKKPEKSSLFVSSKQWKELADKNLNLLICHARAASTGMGAPSTNSNNHPFVSKDKSLAIVHNGRINEYEWLKKIYDTKSFCDSEIILRMFEYWREQSNDFININNELVAKSLNSVKQIFAHVNVGAMAVAVAEHLGTLRHLWLFRNDERPLCLVDLRKELGQIFFVSSPDVWFEGPYKNKEFESINFSKKPVQEITEDQAYLFVCESEESLTEQSNFWTFYIKKGTKTALEEPKNKVLVKEGDAKFEVVTDLNEYESHYNYTSNYTGTHSGLYGSYSGSYSGSNSNFDIEPTKEEKIKYKKYWSDVIKEIITDKTIADEILQDYYSEDKEEDLEDDTILDSNSDEFVFETLKEAKAMTVSVDKPEDVIPKNIELNGALEDFDTSGKELLSSLTDLFSTISEKVKDGTVSSEYIKNLTLNLNSYKNGIESSRQNVNAN